MRTTHVKTTWIRRGNGIPASDQTTYWVHITRHDDLLTVVTIQEDPIYLTEPHVVSRVWRLDPRGNQGGRAICNTANEIPRLEDSGIVPHYLPGQNPEADFMMRTYNLPKEAALGYAQSLYPEYRHTLKSIYTPPASCGRYCSSHSAHPLLLRSGTSAHRTSPRRQQRTTSSFATAASSPRHRRPTRTRRS